MKVHRLDSPTDSLSDPLSDAWSGIEAEVVELAGAPLDNQPTRYIREAYSGESFGAVGKIAVKLAETDAKILIRLEWADLHEDRAHHENGFPDAAAVMFPLRGQAPLASMGSEDEPVGLWHWRPDLEGEAAELVATGLGTVEPATSTASGRLSARSAYFDGTWAVVLARGIGSGGSDSAELGEGGAAHIAFAVWEGSAGERGGFKSTSTGWRELERGGTTT